MPFKVKFEIFEHGKDAACFTTYDARLAKVEYNDRKDKNPWVSMTHTITKENLTKAEEYVWLVYEVRKAIHKYYNGGRHHEDLVASLVKEKELDMWNTRTRTYLNNHPKAQYDEKAKAFFIIVEAWREKWTKYFASKKSGAVSKAVLDQMKKECFDYEKQIDKYVKKVIGLV